MIIPTPKEKKKKEKKNLQKQPNTKKKPEILENVPASMQNGNLKVLLENQGE